MATPSRIDRELLTLVPTPDDDAGPWVTRSIRLRRVEEYGSVWVVIEQCKVYDGNDAYMMKYNPQDTTQRHTQRLAASDWEYKTRNIVGPWRLNDLVGRRSELVITESGVVELGAVPLPPQNLTVAGNVTVQQGATFDPSDVIGRVAEVIRRNNDVGSASVEGPLPAPEPVEHPSRDRAAILKEILKESKPGRKKK